MTRTAPARRRPWHWIAAYWNERTHCGRPVNIGMQVVFAVTGKKENAAQMRRVTCKTCRRWVLGDRS